jgi:ribosome biogenesis GTPase
LPSGFGRRADLSAELEALGEPGLTAARVLAQHRGLWLTATDPDSEPRLQPARGRLRATPPVTGDWVAIDSSGAIVHILERSGTLVRQAAGKAMRPQVLAANVDLVLVAEALPEPNEGRAARLAALALADGIPAALVLTKADLDPDADLAAAGMARRLGFTEALTISAKDGTGLGLLQTLLEPECTTVLLGASGAGKSTLVNALLGEERQATQPVRASDGRGRHTTVTRELIRLSGGALLVDTPGLREVALWESPKDTFEDIAELASGCRFADCRHDTEPGCAVRDTIDRDRLAVWGEAGRERAALEDRKASARRREESGRDSVRQVREAQAAERL